MPLSERDSFAVLRHVDPLDHDVITASIIEALQIKSTPDERNFGRSVILLRRKELYDEMKLSGLLTDDSEENITKIIDPAIPSSLEDIDVPVESVEFFGNDQSWPTLGLVMNDAEGALTAERREYLGRARQRTITRDNFTFKVPLVNVRPERATPLLLARISSAVPSIITLNPVETVLPKTRHESPRPTAPETSSHRGTPRRQLSNSDVRTVGTGIPQSLLDSLRRPQ